MGIIFEIVRYCTQCTFLNLYDRFGVRAGTPRQDSVCKMWLYKCCVYVYFGLLWYNVFQFIECTTRLGNFCSYFTDVWSPVHVSVKYNTQKVELCGVFDRDAIDI